MPNSTDYHIKNIKRQLVLLTSAIAHIKDRKKRVKYTEIIEEIQDTDLIELEALVKDTENNLKWERAKNRANGR